MSKKEFYAEAKRFLDALTLMERVADARHLLAMNDLGDIFFFGDCMPQEYERAFAWYIKRRHDGKRVSNG